MEGVIKPHPPQLPTVRRRRILLLTAVLTVVGSIPILTARRTSPSRNIHPPLSRSSYRNTQPGVKYTGDSSCAGCHAEIAATYRRHPMGNSLFPVADASAVTPDAESAPLQFEAHGFRYSIERRAGRVFHKEFRQDASGRAIAQIEAEVQFAVGSGRRAVSYLIERDGFLFESPITWYAKDKRLGLSPGFDKSSARFERPILAECLFCHANRVERATSAVNRYRTPIFRGHAIGCERCHGPGELHIGRPELVDGIDMTIVNPANLEPSLRDAVCEQCHLTGPTRVSRLGTRGEEYRPGLPFQDFWSVFVPKDAAKENRFASQPEQMHASRCYQSSRRQLGCISCHDPHVMPSAAEKVAYFRNRCLECHAERGCALPANVRVQKQGSDNCIGCHMPRRSSSNITHVATTNHRVPRLTNVEETSPGDAEANRPTRSSLVNFHRDVMNEHDCVLTERDRGIALCRGGGEGAAALALPLLQAAVADSADDLTALECLGDVLGRLRRPAEGLAAYKKAVAQEPTRQIALEGAAYLSFESVRYKDSIEFWKQAIAVNPWRSDYHVEIAAAALQLRDWRAAAQACRDALRLNPTLVPARKWLVQCELELGNVGAARSEFGILAGFGPPDLDDLKRWFTISMLRRTMKETAK
jgi:tetratricopeptide (TPR) repeat protein